MPRQHSEVSRTSSLTAALLATLLLAWGPAAGVAGAQPVDADGPATSDELQPDQPIDFSGGGPWVVDVRFPDRATVEC